MPRSGQIIEFLCENDTRRGVTDVLVSPTQHRLMKSAKVQVTIQRASASTLNLCLYDINITGCPSLASSTGGRGSGSPTLLRPGVFYGVLPDVSSFGHLVPSLKPVPALGQTPTPNLARQNVVSPVRGPAPRASYGLGGANYV